MLSKTILHAKTNDKMTGVAIQNACKRQLLLNLLQNFGSCLFTENVVVLHSCFWWNHPLSFIVVYELQKVAVSI